MKRRALLTFVGLGFGVLGLPACRSPSGDLGAGLKDEGVADSVATSGACVAALPSLKSYDWVEDTGRDELQNVFKACLGEYIRINTVNPPGNEAAGVEFLESMFAAMGVASRRVDVTDGAGNKRANLIAGWPALDQGRGIVLMNHIDVVDGHEADWRKIQGADNVPFSGAMTEFDGEWVMMGRGAIDMKNIGIMQALTLGLLKARGAQLPVPVYFVATADEENGAAGIIGLMKEAAAGTKAPELRDPFVVLNEGGFGIRGALGTASTLHAIGAEERGGAWLEVGGADFASAMRVVGTLALAPNGVDVAKTRLALKAQADAASCKVVSASTSETKVNVVPSKAVVRLVCGSDPSDELLQKAFDPTPMWEKRKAAWRAAGTPTPVAVTVARSNGAVDVALSTATTGHGSSFVGISALDALAFGAQVLGAVPQIEATQLPKIFDYQLTAASRRLLSTAAKHQDILGGIIPSVETLDQYLDKVDTLFGQKVFAALATKFGVDKLFRTACTWTGLAADAGGAKLTLDCRLIDTSAIAAGAPNHPETFVTGLKQHFASQGLGAVTIKTLTGWNFTSSPTHTAIYAAIAESMEKSFPGSIATPILIPGGTDSSYMRDPSMVSAALRGVPAYGVTPAVVTADVVSTFHGSDERFPVSMFAASVRAYMRMVSKVAAVAN